MTILKVINTNYDTFTSIQNLYNYVMNPEKLEHGICNSNLLYTQLGGHGIAQQFCNIADYYGKTGSLAMHYIICYDDITREFPLSQIIHTFKTSIVNFYEYPFFYAMHENTDNLHIHLVLCSINLYTGKKYLNTKNNHENFRAKLDTFTAISTQHPHKKNKKALFIPGCGLVYG